ncbi:MAG: hypothetical protein JW765_11570 [Deltaproteobacteria bacterium]|nr:hypothetical protein [Candidatus Zymogenaceae bacterium]
MTDYRYNPATAISQAPFGKAPFNSAALKPGKNLYPIISRLPAVLAVYAALSGHLRRPLNVLSLDGDPERFISFFVPDPTPAQAGSDHYDLLVYTIPRHTGDKPDGTALLDAAGACAGGVGAVLFETVWDDRAAERRDILPDDLRRLRQKFAFLHAVSEHDDDGGPGRRVLLFCSNQYWYANGHMGAFDSWAPYSSEITGGFRQGTRRYFFCTDKIVKNYCFCGSPAQGDRREMESEVSFLSDPPIEGKSIPRLVAYHIGGSDGVLVMERLPGILLTTAVLQGIDYNSALVLRDVLERLYDLERVGLYHNDIAQWNVLVNGNGGSALIDFASISDELRSSHWPYDPILHFFLFAQTVIRRRFLSSPMGLFPIVPFDLPRWYRRWAAQVWSRPREQRNFALLRTCLEAALDDRPSRRRQPGVIGMFSRWFRRLLYSRALVALQIRSFVKRLEIVTIRGIVRYAFTAVDRSSAPQPIRPLHHVGRPHSQD